MAGNIVIPSSRTPSQSQGSFLELAKVTQAQNHGTIMADIEVNQAIWIIGMRPVRIKENEDVIFIVLFGSNQAVLEGLIQNLEIEEPRVEIGTLILRHHKVGPNHEIFIQADHS